MGKFNWTLENCKEEALKYDNKIDYRKFSYSSYDAAIKHKWIEIICTHMKVFRKPNGYWTKEICSEEARKYTNLNDFMKYSCNAYAAARRFK